MPMVLERDNAIAHLREVMGATNPDNAAEGTIRKAHATNVERNVIHGSDSPQAAEREINLFFDANEIVEWQPAGHTWVYDAEDLS